MCAHLAIDLIPGIFIAVSPWLWDLQSRVSGPSTCNESLAPNG